jgi:hypothetical protein
MTKQQQSDVRTKLAACFAAIVGTACATGLYIKSQNIHDSITPVQVQQNPQFSQALSSCFSHYGSNTNYETNLSEKCHRIADREVRNSLYNSEFNLAWSCAAAIAGTAALGGLLTGLSLIVKPREKRREL